MEDSGSPLRLARSPAGVRSRRRGAGCPGSPLGTGTFRGRRGPTASRNARRRRAESAPSRSPRRRRRPSARTPRALAAPRRLPPRSGRGGSGPGGRPRAGSSSATSMASRPAKASFTSYPWPLSSTRIIRAVSWLSSTTRIRIPGRRSSLRVFGPSMSLLLEVKAVPPSVRRGWRRRRPVPPGPRAWRRASGTRRATHASCPRSGQRR